MLKPRRDGDFPVKPLRAKYFGEVPVENLDRDLSTVFPIKSLVNRRHPTTPQLTLELIAISHDSLLARQRIAHRTASWEVGPSRVYPYSESGNRR